MKARKNIYLVTGIILVVLNLLIDLVNINDLDPVSGNAAYNAGYIMGSHILLLIGSVFLVMAYRLHKKIKMRENDELQGSIDEIGRD